MLQVTPAELIDVDFRKPKHRNSKSTVHYEEQDSASALPVKKTKVTTGPQDVPKIGAETFIIVYTSQHRKLAYLPLFLVLRYSRTRGQQVYSII